MGCIRRQPDAWYRGPQGARIAANIRSNQSPLGDWPKNVDNSAGPYQGDPAAIRGTFDNGATVGELRFLARAFRATHEVRDRDAFLKGFEHILAARCHGWLAAVVAAGQGISQAHHLQRQHHGQPDGARSGRGGRQRL